MDKLPESYDINKAQGALESPGQPDVGNANLASTVHQRNEAVAASAQVASRRAPPPVTAPVSVAAAKRSSIVIPASAQAGNRQLLNVQTAKATQDASSSAPAKKPSGEAPSVSTG